MNPFQILINWLRGIPLILDTKPTVLVTLFIIQSETKPVLPPAGSGAPTPTLSPLYVFSGEASIGSEADVLSVTAYLAASPCPDAGFGAIVCTTGIQWDGAEVVAAKSVELPGLAFTYAPDWPCPELYSLSVLEVAGDVTVSSEGGSAWVEFQTNVGNPGAGGTASPYWCVFYLAQSGQYRGPIKTFPTLGKPPEILHE